MEFAPEGANKNVGADSISARRATADGRALFLSGAQRRDPPNLLFIIYSLLFLKKGVTQLNTEKVISRDNDYILHTYGRSQVVLAEGEGMTARDADGKSYLDFTSGIGVNSLGYCHPAWVRAVADQAATLQHTSNLYYTAPDGKLAKKLCRRTGLDAVFFGN